MRRVQNRDPRRFWGWVALAALLVASHGAVIFGGRTLLPIAPSNGVLPHVPYAYQGPVPDGVTTADPEGALNAGYAFDAYAAAALARGSLPLWNPHQGLGQPFLANALSAVLYPPNWLHLLLPHAWWDLVYLLNLFLGAAFLYAWLRLLGLDLLPALVGSAAVLANGYFQMYLALREVVAVAAWWPLLLCGVEVALRRPHWPLRHLLLAVPVYCTITAGQPEVTFFSLLSVAIFGLVRVAARGREAGKALVAIVPGTAAGILLAAPMWVNFVDYAHAAYSMHPIGSWYGDLHMPHASLATYFFPNLYGRLHTEPFGPIEGYLWNLSPGWLPALALFLALRALWLAIRGSRTGVTFFAVLALVVAAKSWGLPGVQALGRLPILEMLIFPRYAGFLLVLALAILAAHGGRDLALLDARRWRGWVAAWLALVSVVWVAGVAPLWPALPGGAPTRSSALPTLLTFGGLGLAWATLAPLALWWLRARRPDETRSFHLLAGLGIVLQGIANAPYGYKLATFAASSSGCLALYLGFALALGTLRRPHPRLLVASGLAAILLASLLPSLSSFRGLPARHDPLAEAPYLEVLASLQEGNLHRSYSLDGMPQPNFAMPFEISSLNNLEAFVPSWSARFSVRYLDRGGDPLFFGGNHSMGRDPRHTPASELLHNGRWFDLVGVRAVSARRGSLTAFSAGQLVATYADDTGVEIWSRPRALPRVFLAPSVRVAASWEEALARLEETVDPSRTVWIEEPPGMEGGASDGAPPGHVVSFRLEPNDVWVEYEAGSPGVLVLSDSWAEGWRARLDGREVPVLRVDGVFRGVRIESAGTHRVHFQYRPPLWNASLGLAGLGGLLLLLGPGFDRAGRGRVPRSPPAQQERRVVPEEARRLRGAERVLP